MQNLNLWMVIIFLSISCLFCSPQISSVRNPSVIEDFPSKINLIPKEPKRLYNFETVAYIKGTWKGVQREQAFVIQTSYIECWRDDLECMEATAYLDPNGFLGLNIDYYNVISWNDSKLVIINENAECVTYIITAFFNEKTAFKKRTIRKDSPKNCNEIVEIENWDFELVDGIEFGLAKQSHKIE